MCVCENQHSNDTWICNIYKTDERRLMYLRSTQKCTCMYVCMYVCKFIYIYICMRVLIINEKR